MRLTLAISPCPNDTFIFHAWIRGRIADAPPVDVTFADIDACNRLTLRGEPDVAKISYAAYPDVADRYTLVPAGGAIGRGCGPLVLTAGRTDLSGARVAIPGPATTAFLLFRLWPSSRAVAGFEVMPFEKIMPAVRNGTVDAGVVIHESRFTYPAYGLTAVADLGDWWEADTGLPIPLGAIVARRGIDTAQIADGIRRSLEAAWADPSACQRFVAEHAQELDPDVITAHIRLYVNEFSADLSPEGLAAVETLFTRAAAAGVTRPLPAGALELPAVG
ncbi:MAG: 1,4-dihydroxy-6-naphthoate synthase [Frankiaceae bacterium]